MTAPTNSSSASLRESLALVEWLIVRNDNLRAAVASRGSLVLTADGVLLGLMGIGVDKTLATIALMPSLERALIVLTIAIATCLLVASLAYATGSALSVWKTGHSLGGIPPEDVCLFNARSAIAHCKTQTRFSAVFQTLTPRDLLEQSLSELWQLQLLYRHRYSSLRKAVRYLLLAVVVLVVLSLILILATQF